MFKGELYKNDLYIRTFIKKRKGAMADLVFKLGMEILSTLGAKDFILPFQIASKHRIGIRNAMVHDSVRLLFSTY